MSGSRKLGLITLFLVIIVIFAASSEALQQVSWLNFFPANKEQPITRQVVVVEEESAVTKAVQEASPAVVSIVEKSVVFDLFRGPRLTESSIGTGFGLEPNLIITNKHVVANGNAEYTVVTKDDQRFMVDEILRDPFNDLAIIRVAGAGLPTLKLADSDQIKVGQTAIAIGNALGRYTNTVTKGVISGIGRGITASSGLGQPSETLQNVLQTDAALNPGNSGGPLLNLQAEVVGVNVAIGQGTENIGFAIPSNYVKELLDNYKANGRIVRPYLGIKYVMITKSMSQENDLPEGAFVQEIAANSAADKAGIMANDIIVAIDDESVNEENLLASIIQTKKVGDQIKLKIYRKGKELELTATLLEFSP